MTWQPIETAPHDGRIIHVKRVYQGEVIKDGEAVFDWPHPQAPMLEPLGPDPIGRLTPAFYSADVETREKCAITKRWLIPNRLYAFPEPTHWMPSAEQAEEHEMGEWQTIETAPKDGSSVIAWSDGEVWVAAWDSETSSGSPWGWTDSRENGCRINPTHWMPLPEPPQ